MTGRDTEAELALAHEAGTGRWRVAGAARSAQLSQSRAAILAALRAAGEPMTPAQLAKTLGQSAHNVQVVPGRLVKAGEATQPSRGWYTLANEATPLPPCDNREIGDFAAGHTPLRAADLTVVTDLTGGYESSPVSSAAPAGAVDLASASAAAADSTASSVPPDEPAPVSDEDNTPSVELPCARCA